MTRVFSKAKDMYVYLQAYERGADHDPAAGGLRDLLPRPGEGVRNAPAAGDRRLGRQVEEPCPCASAWRSASCLPGRYNCQVTVVDPTTQKAAFWQAPVMLVP